MLSRPQGNARRDNTLMREKSVRPSSVHVATCNGISNYLTLRLLISSVTRDLYVAPASIFYSSVARVTAPRDACTTGIRIVAE